MKQSHEPLPTDQRLPIPLYHGTSSLFLDGIIKFGLGGRNPIVDWQVLDFAKAIYPLVEEHLSHTDAFMLKAGSFKLMVEQKSAAMNFQHGETYLSPAASTAVRYAVNKKYGSELLTYTLDFLEELLRRKINGVADALFRRYPQIFEKLDISPAPLLIRIDGLPAKDLLAEDGSDAACVLNYVYDIIQKSPNDTEVLLQQCNFRLCRSVSVAELKLWFINVTQWNPFAPKYSLYPLSVAQ
jgi:hypothetical protein